MSDPTYYCGLDNLRDTLRRMLTSGALAPGDHAELMRDCLEIEDNFDTLARLIRDLEGEDGVAVIDGVGVLEHAETKQPKEAAS